MDLNILIDPSSDDNETLKKVIQRAFELGYEVVALNTVINTSNLSGKNISIPEPKSIELELKSSRNFRILNRLTVAIEDSIHSHLLLRSPIAKKYDLLAVQPVGEKMIQHVCSSIDIDIICLDLTESFGFTLKRTYIGQAIHKGACFEITYAPCLRDQTAKRRIISNSQILVDVTKGKNVFISSAASKPIELRSVEDVINLGLLFGFTRNQCPAAVRSTGKLALLHAGTRTKTGCGFVSLSGLYRLPKHQGWIVKACKVPKIADITSASVSKRNVTEVSDAEEESVSKKPKFD